MAKIKFSRKTLAILATLALASVVASAVYLQYFFERTISINVLEPLSFVSASETGEYNIAIYPGQTFAGSGTLLTISNKAPIEYTIVIDYSVELEGNGTNFVNYDFTVEGEKEGTTKITENKIEFVIPPNGEAKVIFEYWGRIPTNIEAGNYQAIARITLRPSRQ